MSDNSNGTPNADANGANNAQGQAPGQPGRSAPRIHFTINGRSIPFSATGPGRGRFVVRGVQPGRGRIPMHAGRGPIPASTNPNRPAPNLPPLQPQVLPESQQEITPHNNNDQSDDKDSHTAFKCSICLENMVDPSGCGKCSARFCYNCLKRVAEQPVQQQHPPTTETNQPNSPKCPVCRSSIDDVEDIQRDAELRGRMDQIPPVPCRYNGCQEMLRISQVVLHEAQCPHVKLQCRYHPFGCTWTGKRADLQQHEREECHLAKVSQLVERHRQMQAEMSSLAHGVAHLHQNVMTNSAVMELQRSRDNQRYSPGNIFHLFQFIHVLTCCTVRFLVANDPWMVFLNPLGQALVANFLTCLPTNIMILKTVASSYQLMLMTSRSMGTEDEVLDFLDATLYFLFGILVAAVIGLCFYGEGSPGNWNKLRLQFPQFIFNAATRESHLLLYSVTFAVASSHAIALEITGNVLRASLLWAYLCITTTVFPALISGMLNARPPVPSHERILELLHRGKAAKPLWVGLCYAPCTVAFGIMASIDAAVALFLSQDFLKKILPVGVLPVGDILAELPIAALYVYGGARLAMRATDFPNVDWIYSLDFLVVALFVIVTKYVLWINYRAGTRIGIRIWEQSRQRVNSVARTEYHGLGIFFFTGWCMLLGAIVVT